MARVAVAMMMVPVAAEKAHVEGSMEWVVAEMALEVVEMAL